MKEIKKTMILKTDTEKELEKKLITGFLSDRGPTDGRTDDVINNLIKILKYFLFKILILITYFKKKKSVFFSIPPVDKK